jgi:hypothetical protein
MRCRSPAGATVARRDVLDGKVWKAPPDRVIADVGQELVFAAGIECPARERYQRQLNRAPMGHAHAPMLHAIGSPGLETCR